MRPTLLLVDTCSTGALHSLEFVEPVVRSVQAAGARPKVIHYRDLHRGEKLHLETVVGIIICGSALGDNEALKFLDSFQLVVESDVPVLGICQGMAILSAIFNSEISRREEIGLTKIVVEREDPVLGSPRQVTVYELHMITAGAPNGFAVLAGSPCCIQAYADYDSRTWGLLFHPEVRNKEMIHSFVRLCTEE